MSESDKRDAARKWQAELIKKHTNLTSEQADRKAGEIARQAEKESREKKKGS
jgi:hypothetical protein